MYYLLSMLTGVLVAIMVVANGKLADGVGVYSSTVMIHIVGLVFISLIYMMDKKAHRPKVKLPFYLYSGGFIGVATVVFGTLAYGKISVSALLALSLLGQSITSIFFDQFGWFGMPKSPFKKRKMVGLAFVIIGTMIMISQQDTKEITAITLSLLSGLTVVLSRTTNARLAEETSKVKSTMYNYIIGLVTALIILLIAGRGESFLVSFKLPANVWVYTGGIIGAFSIVLLNITVTKISSFYLTLLLFVGQVFAGIVIDILLSGSFSVNNLIGGLLVAAGLCLNVWFDKISQQKSEQMQKSKTVIIPENI